MTRLRPLIAGTIVGLIVLAAPVLAAPSPSPSASDAAPSESPPATEPPPDDLLHEPQMEAWLDRPLPDNVAAGSTFDVGVTLWDADVGTVGFVGTAIFVRAHPASGAADPITSNARQNWRGHYVGRVGVPEGGLGLVEFGVTGTVCENDICEPEDWIFTVAGTGPPPDAPFTSIAAADIAVPAEPIVAGRPVELTVRLRLNAPWELSSVPIVNAVFVRAREPQGPNVAATAIPVVDPVGLTYTGSMTIPEAGDLVLEAAMDADGGDATRFGTSMTRVTVEPGAAPVASPVAPGGDQLPQWLVIVMIALVAVGGGILVAGFRHGGAG